MNIIESLVPALRVLLGDDDPDAVYDYTDAQLVEAVKAVLLVVPALGDVYSVSGDPAVITPSPEGADVAKLSLEAAILRASGTNSSYSVKTRAMSYTQRPEGARQMMRELGRKLQRVSRGEEAKWVSTQDYYAWLMNAGSGIYGDSWQGRALHVGLVPTA